jgi:hypothetical protein
MSTLQRFYTGAAVETIGDLEFAAIAADDETAARHAQIEDAGRPRHHDVPRHQPGATRCA